MRYNGLTLLMSAAFHQSFNIFDYLFDKNVDLEGKDNKGYTVLSYAVMGASDIAKSFDPSIINLLINSGANVNVKDHRGLSLTTLAIHEGQYFTSKKISKDIEEYNK